MCFDKFFPPKISKKDIQEDLKVALDFVEYMMNFEDKDKWYLSEEYVRAETLLFKYGRVS